MHKPTMRDYGMHFGKWITAVLLTLWVSIPTAVIALMGFVLIDFITGLASAFVRKEVDSSVGVRGGVKKCLIILLVLSMHWAERPLGMELHIEKFMGVYFIIIELISIVENCARAGIGIPASIVIALVKVRALYPHTMSTEEVEEAFKRIDPPAKSRKRRDSRNEPHEPAD